ncbi:MAG: hypothetical protein P1U89_17045 [Verrucomicrobiales bacterium]|nr:hypothetical protein [Verrucomicrobiales bacterium]
MKSIVYWVFVSLLLIAEAFATYIFIRHGENGYVLAGMVHLTVAFLFGILTGFHRRSISAALLSVLVIGTNPVAGILTMILIDEKFNRETRQNYFEASEGFEIGNPFISLDGAVEMADNSQLALEDYESVMKRVMSVGNRVSEREVEVITSMRNLKVLPLLEKVASSTAGEGRVLAQAAISELSERAAVWAANLHRLEVNKNTIPGSLERLAVVAYLRIKKQGRSAQAFGLPDAAELENLLRLSIQKNESAETVTLLSELLIFEEKLEAAQQLHETFRKLDGFDYEIQQAKVFSARGDWMQLLRTLPSITPAHWSRQSEEVRRFWGAA